MTINFADGDTYKLYNSYNFFDRMIENDRKLCKILTKESSWKRFLAQGTYGKVYNAVIQNKDMVVKYIEVDGPITDLDSFDERYVERYCDRESRECVTDGSSNNRLEDYGDEKNVETAYNRLIKFTSRDYYITSFMTDDIYIARDRNGKLIRPHKNIERYEKLSTLIFNHYNGNGEMMVNRFVNDVNVNIVGNRSNIPFTLNVVEIINFGFCKEIGKSNGNNQFPESPGFYSISPYLKDAVPMMNVMYPNNDIADANITFSMVSILHCLGVVQEKYQIMHNDLHFNNIMLQPIQNVDFIGDTSSSYLTFEYGKHKICFDRQNITHIPKIIDWGFSCKYGTADDTPRIFDVRVMDGVYDLYCPNFYSQAHDIVFMLCRLFLYSVVNHEEGDESYKYWHFKNQAISSENFSKNMFLDISNHRNGRYLTNETVLCLCEFVFREYFEHPSGALYDAFKYIDSDIFPNYSKRARKIQFIIESLAPSPRNPGDVYDTSILKYAFGFVTPGSCLEHLSKKKIIKSRCKLMKFGKTDELLIGKF